MDVSIIGQNRVRGWYEEGVDSDELTNLIAPLLLYVCSADIEIAPRARKAGGRRQRQRQQLGLVDPQIFDIGIHIGATIRSLRNIEEPDGWDEAINQNTHVPTGRTVRPHIRRAHWCSCWIGRRARPSERKKTIKWIAPTIVKEDALDDVLPTIRRLK